MSPVFNMHHYKGNNNPFCTERFGKKCYELQKIMFMTKKRYDICQYTVNFFKVLCELCKMREVLKHIICCIFIILSSFKSGI